MSERKTVFLNHYIPSSATGCTIYFIFIVCYVSRSKHPTAVVDILSVGFYIYLVITSCALLFFLSFLLDRCPCFLGLCVLFISFLFLLDSVACHLLLTFIFMMLLAFTSYGM